MCLYMRSSISALNFQLIRKMSTNLETYFNSALNATKQAGQLIRERFSQTKNIKTKSSEIDFVTETDQQVERLLIDALKKQFPDHKFIGEESVSEGATCELTSTPTWIIDPIDGTMNFVHGFPHSCVSLGLFVDAQPAIGIIYNPVLEQLFTATKGQGAYLNGNKISVSGETQLSNSLVVMEIGASREPEKVQNVQENLKHLVPLIHGVRSLGSAALDMAMVAMGGADVYYEFGIHIWDIAAGHLIVTEAGGVVIDPAGGPIDHKSRRILAAATPQLAQELVKNLKQFYPQPSD